MSGTPLQTGERLTVYRKVPLTQVVDLENAGAFHPEVLEHDGFDRIVMQIQQLDEAIGRALKIDITDDRDVSGLLEELFHARDEAVYMAGKAREQAELSQKNAEYSQNARDLSKAWAESGQNPDLGDPESKSSKTWALFAKDKAQQLTDLAVDCKISNDGVGLVLYHKDMNLLEIVLPFDNSGANLPKVILTDETALNRSDIGASARAVLMLNTMQSERISELSSQTAEALAKKLDKSSVSSALDSESEETALSSKAGKELNDKLSAAATVELKSTRSTTGKWVITGLAVGKPVFCLTNMERQGNVGRMRVLEGANKGGVVTGATPEQVNAGFTFGDAGLGASSECFIFIPTEETVTVEISFNAATMTVYAYQ